jgi:D-threo-aldose 1-dehydrogenase
MFGTGALGNALRSIPDPTKQAIIGEWFRHVAPPVFIDLACQHDTGGALQVLERSLDRLDIAPSEIILNCGLSWRRGSLTGEELLAKQYIIGDGNLAGWDVARRLLSGRYDPQLVCLHAPDEYLTSVTSPVEHDQRFESILTTLRALVELKTAGQVAGVGAAARDWRIIQAIDAAVDLDWVMIAGSLTVMHHPPELLDFIASLAERQIAVVNAAVFHGGFLVGSQRLSGRVADPEDSPDQGFIGWRKSFVALCHGHGISPAHACIQFGLSAPGIVAVALDTTHPDRVAENVESVLTTVPSSLWASMKEERLLAADYPYLG